MQMDKKLLFQIPAQIHLHPQGQAGKDNGSHHLKQHHGKVKQGKAGDPLGGVGRDKGVHRIATLR